MRARPDSLKCVNSAIFIVESVGYRKKLEEIIGAGGKGSQGRGRERPGALLARRTRTIGMCSFDARSKGQPWPLPLERQKERIGSPRGGRAMGDHSAPIPEEKPSELGGIIRSRARRTQWNQHGRHAWESEGNELGRSARAGGVSQEKAHLACASRL